MTSTESTLGLRAGLMGPAEALSEGEAALWRRQLRRPLSAAYNICAVVETGPVDGAVLEAAAAAAVGRQDRLVSSVVEDGPGLYWHREGGLCWRRIVQDGSSPSAWAAGSGAALLREEARRTFQPGQVLHRLVHWDLGDRGGFLQLTMHHAACDGLSLRTLVREVISRYQAMCQGRAHDEWARPVLPYRPVADADSARRFWEPRLVLAESIELLPLTRPVIPVAVDEGELAQRVLDVPAVDAGAGGFTVVLAGLASALSQWSGRQEFAVRIPFSTRRPAEDDEVSYRVRTLPIRLRVAADEPVGDLVARTGRELREATIHADWEDTGPAPTTALGTDGTSVVVVNQLQAGLLHHHRPVPIEAGGLAWRPYLLPTGTAKFDLTVHVAATADGRLALSFESCSARVDRSEVEWFADLAAAVVTGTVTASRSAPVAGVGHRAPSPALRAASAGRAVDVPAVRVEEGLFAAAGQHPWSLAVMDDGHRGAAVTYGQLAEAAEAVAKWLTSQGAGPGRAVAVRMERGSALIAAVHGLLRARGVLLLVDPELPEERARFMLADSRAHLLIEAADEGGLDTLDILGQRLRLTVLDDAGAVIPLARPKDAGRVAYVMYTSGSTGRPKGVAVSHEAIVNRLAWMQNSFPLEPGRVVLAKTPLSFDVCLWELLWPTMTGATLVTARHGRHGDAAYLCDLVERYGIDVLHFVPSMLGAFLDASSQRAMPLRDVFLSGERLSLALARRAHQQLGARVHNLYGPTEAAIDVTAWTYRSDDQRGFVPIGLPIDNTTLTVCDSAGQEVALGAVGELVIFGVPVALGYLGDGTLDEGRFGTDPQTGARTYRTGDLVRWRSGPVLEYLGRVDGQVKILGQRVELEEIDAVLAEHPNVAAAGVVHRPGEGARRLHAYLVLADTAVPMADELRAYAAERLPAAMVPTVYSTVVALPHTASGKLDRTALATMPGTLLPVVSRPAAPTGRAQEALHAVLAQLLDTDDLPADVDLFHLGLDSITTLRLVAELAARNWAIEAADVFEARTVRALAVRLQPTTSSSPDQDPAADAATVAQELWCGRKVQTRIPLSSLQLGLVFHRDASADYLTYLTSYTLTGRVDSAVLREAIAAAAQRHEMVRSAVDLAAHGGPEQVVLQEVDVDLIEQDLTALAADGQQRLLAAWQQEVRRRPFAWDLAPLFAFHLHRLGPDRTVFSIVEPLLDGWSVAVLGRDILDAYEQTLAHKAVSPRPASVNLAAEEPPSYREFVQLEQAAATDAGALEHWRAVTSSEQVAWRLALAAAPAGTEPAWQRHDHYLDGADLQALRMAADHLQISLRTLVWAVHMRTVALFTGCREPGSTVMVNGRPETEGSEAMVGLFLNMLPVSVRIDEDTTWRDLVAQLVAFEQSSWRHRRTPYAVIRSLSPGFEPSTVFNYTAFHRYQGLEDQDRALRLESITALDQTYLDLTVQCSLDVSRNRLRLSVDHRIPAITRTDARRFLQCLVHAARSAARDVDARVEADRLPAGQLARLEHLGRGPVREWPGELSLARIVDGHAQARPDSVAIEDERETYTYRELAALSRHYAHLINAAGAGEHPVVGVMASRSARYWAAVLAIWRAGGTYVPLSAALPAERLSHMTEQAGLALVFTDPREKPPVLPSGVRGLTLDPLPEMAAAFAPRPQAETAYVLFTSGSTGRPKGARIGPAAMVNHWWAKADLLGLDEESVVSQSAPASFDVSVWQFAVPWLRGGRVVVLSDEALLDAPRLVAELENRQVSLFETVPSHLAALLDALEARSVPWPRDGGLRQLMVTGEALPAEVCRRWLKAGGVPIINAYGPTECADDIAHHVIDHPETTAPVPIGTPIPNIRLTVTDSLGQPVPLGVAGELRVAGACLGEGYLDTADEPGRFLRDLDTQQIVGYRTGDLVRFDEHGRLVWLGRTDGEVKVRGRRLELGDVGTHLRTHPGVKDAATVVVPMDGGRLRAVVVPRNDHISGEKLRAHLAVRLPVWMLPDEITFADRLPLTAHGKLDRTALASPAYEPAAAPAPDVGDQHQAETGEIARIVAEEWSRTTGRLPSEASTFAGDGGTSLDSIRVTARIAARLGVPLTVTDLLASPSFAAFTRLVTERTGTPPPAPAAPHRSRLVTGVTTAVLETADELLDLVPGGRLDAAAVGYLTPAALARAGHHPDEVLARLDGRPVLRRVLVTPLGNVGHYLLPVQPDDLFADPGRLTDLIAQAAVHGKAHGAARTALTGLIPAATGYGTTLPPLATEVTTGHDVTAAAVVLNTARALADSGTGSGLGGHHLAVIGLGSIGRAVVQLLLDALGMPAAITLVESTTTADRLHTARDLVHALGYRGPLACLTSTPAGAPDAVYEASVVIGAASATGLLDIERLPPGTVVVDDSAPHLFDVPTAIARARAGKLHVTEGGVLHWPGHLAEFRWAPTDPVLADVLAAARSYRPTARTSMGCLVAALPDLSGHAAPVTGHPPLAQMRDVLAHLRAAGFDGAPAMLDDTLLHPEDGQP